ncbi:MAG: histidinol-phosphate transaminase [Veillonellaceae bacterium]|jgi:histidinol-phosphate aminotransferase|nr:histidinol-phosphate transaminase [Veillonellaceae bacterium]
MWKFRAGLETLPTYTVEEKEWDIKLDANESPVNLPPLVQEKVISKLSFLAFNRYPEMGMIGLREQIAREFSLTIDHVIIGSGSSEILLALCHALGGSANSIVYPTPSFSMYGIYVKMADSKAVQVPLNADFSLDRDKVVEAARTSKASLIMLCNPNNPTGNVMPPEDIEYILNRADCPVVVDEAYYEFYGKSAVGLLADYKNLIVTRTFSKAYGLASARVGYMLASPELTAAVGKVMMPYHVNALSLAAAEVVYQMRDEFSTGIQQTITERNRMAEALQAVPGIDVYPSEANFILIRTCRAKELNSYLADKGIGVRDFSSSAELADCIRISVGTPVENDILIKTVKAYMERG